MSTLISLARSGRVLAQTAAVFTLCLGAALAATLALAAIDPAVA